MNYVRITTSALVALLPVFAQAQNSQFTNCHSLESSGNFIGPDEALVNGMVCKVVKGKSSSPSSDATATTKKNTEESQALLGLIEPDILRAKEKAKAKQEAAAPSTPTAEAAPETNPDNSAAAKPADPSAFANVSKGSLGAIARGYRNNGAGQPAAPEAVIVEGKNTGLQIEAAKPPSQAPSATAPAAATTSESKPSAEAVVSALPVSPKSIGQEATPSVARAAQAPAAPQIAPSPTLVPALETKSEVANPAPVQAIEAKPQPSPKATAPNIAVSEPTTSVSQTSLVAPVAAPSNTAPPLEAAPAPAAKSEVPPKSEVAVTPSAPAVKSEAESTPAAQPIEAKPQASPTPATPNVAVIETTTSEAQTSLVAPTAGPSNPPAPATAPAPTAAPSNVSQPQAPTPARKTNASLSVQKPAEVETKPEIIPPANAPEKAPELQPEHTAKAAPEPGPDADMARPPLETEADLNPFREGQEATCRRNISLGSMEKEKLFLAIPEWALEWYGKNQKRFPGICFSNSPMSGAKNFLVVFESATPASAEQPKKPAAAAGLAQASDKGQFTTSYGDTWHYTHEQTVTTTITSISADEAPHNQDKPLLFATAYTAKGIPVSQHHRSAPSNPAIPAKEPSKKAAKDHKEPLSPALRAMTDLLGQMVEDIAKL